jgi:hypothetical protein
MILDGAGNGQKRCPENVISLFALPRRPYRHTIQPKLVHDVYSALPTSEAQTMELDAKIVQVVTMFQCMLCLLCTVCLSA